MHKLNHITSRGAALSVFALFLIFSSAVSGADYRNDPQRLIERYFQALQSGDVNILATLLTSPILHSRKILLEQNPAYPEFLRYRYKDSQIMISGAKATDEKHTRIITVDVFFEGDENSLRLEFLLKLTDEGWKISDESRIP